MIQILKNNIKTKLKLIFNLLILYLFKNQSQRFIQLSEDITEIFPTEA